MTEQPINPLEDLVKQEEEKKTLDIRAALRGQTYPTDTVQVFIDAALAHRINALADEAAKKADEAASERRNAEEVTAEEGSIVVPQHVEDMLARADKLDAEVEEAEAEVARLLVRVQKSAQTFHLRGVAPKQILLIDRRANKEFPPISKERFQKEHGDDWLDFWEGAVIQRNFDRDHDLHNQLIAASIVKVENSEGAVDNSAWTAEDVAEHLRGSLVASEFAKLQQKAQELSMSHSIFQRVLEEDADFLSKH